MYILFGFFQTINIHKKKICIFKNFEYTIPTPQVWEMFISIVYYAYKRSEKETTYSFQKSKKSFGQNSNHGRKRRVLYRYCPTKLSSNRFIEKHKFTTSRLTPKLLFCRCRQSK